MRDTLKSENSSAKLHLMADNSVDAIGLLEQKLIWGASVPPVFCNGNWRPGQCVLMLAVFQQKGLPPPAVMVGF